jgi:Flp pilus assembly protein TadD
MSQTTIKLIAILAIVSLAGSYRTWARDGLAITIQKHSQLTPVQRLNREGVDAVNRHQLEKAATLFCKAYLYDPSDPFTLNNLGYISELKGEVDHAQKFYALALEQGSNANIDRSNAKQMQGKPMKYALESLQDIPMQVNRLNVDAMILLSSNRGSDAIALLKKALSMEPQNPFTINNMGVAYETVGEYDKAIKKYGEASSLNSMEPIVVTLNRSWRGKPVSRMAAESAKQLQDRVSKMNPANVQAVMFALRGVSETNQNNWINAKMNFLHAYSINPDSAFSLNNRGYVAERDGDLETAKFFYNKARQANDSNHRIGLATQSSAEGKKLSIIAIESNQQIEGELDRYSKERHQMSGSIELKTRDTVPAADTDATPESSPTLDLQSESSFSKGLKSSQ